MLNFDISETIYKHINAIIIQRCFRKWIMSHVHNDEWILLRKLLCTKYNCDIYKYLQNCSQVRHEWRTEMNSWLYVINNEPDIIYDIIDEISKGLWY